jgi:hypothetical protein
VLYGANFDDEIGALQDHPYDCVIGRRRFARMPKELGIPSIYYTMPWRRGRRCSPKARAIFSLMMSTYRSKARYHKIASFFSETGTPQQTYSSWAPKIDITEHLIVNEAFAPAADAPATAL